jgi:putative transposase
VVTDALEKRSSNPTTVVPWSGFDLINTFNEWKRSEAAGRSLVVTPDGIITKQVTGLVWRHEVSAQVFEEAAVDLGRALAAYKRGRVGKVTGRRVGFPRRKRKGRCRESFRIRNKAGNGAWSIRIGEGHPRSVTLPRIGTVDHGGFVGVDRGLSAFAVAATAAGAEVGRFAAPKPLQRGLRSLRTQSRAASRTQPRSSNHAKAIRRLSREHARITNTRRSFLHEVSSKLVKTHDRLCLEHLAVANLLGNRKLARAISDAAWTEFARQLRYKAAWYCTELVVCDRWFHPPGPAQRVGWLHLQ